MLEEALVDFGGSVLVVSHDRYFLDRVCDQVAAFEGDGIFIQPGNYSYYLEKRKEREKRGKRSATPVGSAQPAPTAPTVRVRKRSFKEQKEFEGMEAAIHTAEERVSELVKMLDDPEFQLTRFQEISSRVTELEDTKAEVVRLYARWAELESLSG